MKPSLRSLLLVVASTSAFLLPGSADAQIDQQALAQQIRSGDPDERIMAVEMAGRIAPAAVGPELRGSLIDALADANSAYTLRFMIDRAETSPLSPATLARIRSVARERLTGKQSVTVLWNAIDLAVALNDPGLRRIVTSLANDRDEVVARGVTDSDLVERTQKRASDRFAGVPPTPRWQDVRN